MTAPELPGTFPLPFSQRSFRRADASTKPAFPGLRPGGAPVRKRPPPLPLAFHNGQRFVQGQALMDRYGLLQQAEQVDYSRWQDQLKAWQSDSDRAYEYYNSVGKEDRDLYSTMLKYYAGKAADEQKAAGGVRYGSGRTVEGEKPQSLSSTASDSLERAMGNYLKAGDTRSAQTLITRYKERMTPTQKKRFSALFDKYGAAIGW